MRNLLVTICYDGKNYHGWQVQKNALTIQEIFQNSLKKITNEQLNIKGCSRTDSKVHANMYCISVKINHKIACSNLVLALNKYLPSDIAVLDCIEVPLDFHARYSCTGKEYIYKIWNHPVRNPFLNGYAYHYWHNIDTELLNKAAKDFIGKHDFTSFCTADNRTSNNMVRTVSRCEVARNDSLVTITVSADGFLYNMVRIIVGTLLRIVQGKIPPYGIPDIIKAKDRTKAGFTACACGLYLNKVFY